MTATTFSAAQIGHNIIQKCISHIGEIENRDAQGRGLNSGADVNRYLSFCGVDLSLPASEKSWCACFASFCTFHVLQDMGLLGLPYVKTASSHEAVNWGFQHNTIIRDPYAVLPGDWCIFKGGNGEAAQNGVPYHHTTVVEYLSISSAVCHVVAGNDNDRVERNQIGFSGCTIFRPYVLK